ncbi:MAG: GNAT family N-acetyltransferase [Sulfitobacter sp.]
MFDAIHTGFSPYSAAQKTAWISAPRAGDMWNERLKKQDIILAEVDGQIVAFMSLEKNGYLDFAFVLPAHRGHGLFRLLHEHIEKRATDLGHHRIWVHASLMAETAFKAVGYTQIKRESVLRGTERLERFEMEKQL